jgi:single-strand DNA-binding protein
MEHLNKVELRGTLGVLRVMPVGTTRCATMNVATNYCYKDAEGCPVIETTWHLVTVWEGKGCPDLSVFEKGDSVHIIGRLRNRRYVDASGMERNQTDIIAQTLEKA